MNSLLDENEPKPDTHSASKAVTHAIPIFDPPITSILDENAGEETGVEPYVLSESKPLTTAETIRSSGLAWSAAIALFAAVIVMLIIGWGADLLLGSSPWGIVVGMIIGAAIGFFQFFRITNEILKK
jgi:hypothetical protein